jgi:hypothetical protein
MGAMRTDPRHLGLAIPAHISRWRRVDVAVTRGAAGIHVDIDVAVNVTHRF